MVEESATIDDPLLRQSSEASPRHPALTIAYHHDASFIGARRVLVGGLTLGRKSEAFGAGAFADGLLSREHARFDKTEAGIVVRDLGSRNGTLVNGDRVEEARLVDGDLVSLGSVALIFRHGPLRFKTPKDPLLIGVSAALAAVLEEIDAVAAQPLTVLIRGETGVGKELVARRIHEESGQSGAFVAINCGGVADGVVHSELFGHERGAFSGASAERAGLVESAAGGTLLLDEIGDAPAALQTSLLRLLQSHEYRRVGSDLLRHSDARVVAATHVDLEPAVAAGAFRQDLLARLRHWVIDVPPLRDRREDVIPIALSIAARASRARTIARPLAIALLRQTWPDNVRGLAAVVEQAALESHGDEVVLTPRVAARLEAMAEKGSEAASPEASEPVGRAEVFKKQRPDEAYLRKRFVELDGNVKALAKELGVARNTLYRWFEEASIDPKTLRR